MKTQSNFFDLARVHPLQPEKVSYNKMKQSQEQYYEKVVLENFRWDKILLWAINPDVRFIRLNEPVMVLRQLDNTKVSQTFFITAAGVVNSLRKPATFEDRSYVKLGRQ